MKNISKNMQKEIRFIEKQNAIRAFKIEHNLPWRDPVNFSLKQVIKVRAPRRKIQNLL